MRAPLILTFLLLCSAVALAAPDDEVRALLDKQVAAWNAHDLPAYMAGYWKSDQLTFYSGGTVTRGWQPTLERYQQRYQAKGKEMGNLGMPGMEVSELGPRMAMVRGSWVLNMSDGSRIEGLFTVILKKLPEGWRIIHDHSSSK